MKRYIHSVTPVVAALMVGLGSTLALADKISHPTAVFSGLDKITGRIISFDVASDETVQFGSLQITPHACFTRPTTETPLTSGFVEVDEVQSTKENKRVFSGWMFAATPGLSGLEHPVYDVWLTDCKGGSTVTRETVALPEENILPPQPKPGTVPRPRQQARPNVDGAPPTQRARNAPLPPANLPPVAAAPAQRRTPVQSFFPTFASPSDYRERDRAVERAFER